MKEQIPEEEQKQDKLSSQEILNCMKIIFYLSLFLGFIWTLFYFCSIGIMPEIGNLYNFLFYLLVIFFIGILILGILILIEILPGGFLYGCTEYKEKDFLKKKAILRLAKIETFSFIIWFYFIFSILFIFIFKYLQNFSFLFAIAIIGSILILKLIFSNFTIFFTQTSFLLLLKISSSLLFYSISLFFLLFLPINKNYFEIILFLFILSVINGTIATTGILLKTFIQNQIINSMINCFIIVFPFLILFFSKTNIIFKIPFQLLKLGSYNATLIIDKTYADKINLSDFCNLYTSNNQSYKFNPIILSSIGSEYIIKCKKYKKCIIKISKEKILSVILKENKNNKSQKITKAK